MNTPMDRRQVLRGAVLLGGAATVGALAGGAPALAAPAGFPSYRYIGTPFTKANLRYNPTNELIFPCIRGVSDKIGNALARYYLYYAPHDAPGGICLAYGNNLDREIHLGVFHYALPGAPDNGRSAAASFGTQDGVQYMFYEAGPRLQSTIAVARAV